MGWIVGMRQAVVKYNWWAMGWIVGMRQAVVKMLMNIYVS